MDGGGCAGRLHTHRTRPPLREPSHVGGTLEAMQSEDLSGIVIDADGLGPAKVAQAKSGKRGRKQDNTLPPSVRLLS